MSHGVITSLLFFLLLPAESDRKPDTSGMDLNAKVAVQDPLPQQWMTSFEEARREAVRHNLPMLLHFDATWCGACRRMDREVLHKPGVTAMLGVRVIGVKLDADHNKDLIRKFGISTLPTEIVVQPDGSKGSLMKGAVSLSSYTARLSRIASDQSIADNQNTSANDKDIKPNTRACLIVERDGRMVGMGGYSPVSLVAQRQWKKGSDQFVATFESVEYFLLSQEEVVKFNASPEKYIPKMHGCDLVALYRENRATAGAIEYGSIYDGKYYFFASLENRNRFKRNPKWYLGVMTDSRTENDESFPFLNRDSMPN